MTTPNEQVEIDVVELSAHQHRLADVVISVRNAHEAADTPLNRDAFGAFGHFLAGDCAEAMSDGREMLLAAQEAATEHHRKVGTWAQDVDATESEISGLFSTAPEMRDA